MSSQSGRCVKERSLGSSSLAFVFIEFGLFASEFGDFYFFCWHDPSICFFLILMECSVESALWSVLCLCWLGSTLQGRETL
jgi:hypothetical protein